MRRTIEWFRSLRRLSDLGRQEERNRWRYRSFGGFVRAEESFLEKRASRGL